MKLVLIPLLFISFVTKSQDFKNYKNAHEFLTSKVQGPKEVIRKLEFGFVLLQSTIVKGKLSNIKTLYADTKILESDACKALRLSSGMWKFCPDSTVVIIPFSYYYNFDNAANPTRYIPGGSSRPFDLISSDEVINGTILPTVHCKISHSESY